jgi:hypothetical protein
MAETILLMVFAFNFCMTVARLIFSIFADGTIDCGYLSAACGWACSIELLRQAK